jgi:hypothetical protein
MDDYSPIGSWNIYEFYWHISMIHHDSPIESSQNGNTCQYIPILSQVWSLSGHYLVIMQLYPHDIPTKNIPVLSPPVADEVEEALLPDNGGMKRAAL